MKATAGWSRPGPKTGTRSGDGSQSSAPRRRAGKLDVDRAERVGAVPGWAWDPLEDQWEEGFVHLHYFAEREGHARVPGGFLEDGFNLGAWVIRQRSAYTNAILSDVQVGQLEVLPGWAWDARADRWENGYQCLRRFIERRGTSRVPQDHVEGVFRLGTWVTQQRSYYRAGKLSAYRSNSSRRSPTGHGSPIRRMRGRRDSGYLRRFVQHEGHSRVPKGFLEEGHKLEVWAGVQHGRYAKGALEPERIARLEGVHGWVWNSRDDRREEGFDHLRRFVEREGHARVPVAFVDDELRPGDMGGAPKGSIQEGDARARPGATAPGAPGVDMGSTSGCVGGRFRPSTPLCRPRGPRSGARRLCRRRRLRPGDMGAQSAGRTC